MAHTFTEGSTTDEVDPDFAEQWGWLKQAKKPVAGQLRKMWRQGPTPGMSHPPQNPEVQKELMLHLQRHQVQATKSPNRSSLMSSGSPRDIGKQDDENPRFRRRSRAGSSTFAGKMSASAPSLGQQSMMRSSSRSAPSAAPKKFDWGNSEEGILTTPKTFDELQRHHDQLRLKSRDHAEQLMLKDDKTVLDLLFNHNSVARVRKKGREREKFDFAKTRKAEGILYSTGLGAVSPQFGPPLTMSQTKPTAAMGGSRSSTFYGSEVGEEHKEQAYATFMKEVEAIVKTQSGRPNEMDSKMDSKTQWKGMWHETKGQQLLQRTRSQNPEAADR